MRRRSTKLAWPGAVFCLLLALAATGCARGRVVAILKPLPPGTVSKSTELLVKPFTIEKAVFTGDNAEIPAIVEKQKKRIPPELVQTLVTTLLKSGYRARPYTAGAGVAGAVLIDGTFTHVNHGSGAARAWWGFGAGAAWMLSEVKLCKADKPAETLAEFKVESSSGGRGGLLAAGDFTTTNLIDLARSIVKFLDQYAR